MDYPTVLQDSEGNDTWGTYQHVVQLPTANEWVYIIIQTNVAQAHPIHLYGHDFWVLEQGTGKYNASNTNLTLTNAPRRDVAMLPASGYLITAIYTDNPRAWRMHYHIACHTSERFSFQLLELESEIAATIDVAAVKLTCANWKAYATADDIVEVDLRV